MRLTKKILFGGDPPTTPSPFSTPIKNETRKNGPWRQGAGMRFRCQLPDTATNPYWRKAPIPRGFERVLHFAR
jgi:hypothetical protein